MCTYHVNPMHPICTQQPTHNVFNGYTQISQPLPQCVEYAYMPWALVASLVLLSLLQFGVYHFVLHALYTAALPFSVHCMTCFHDVIVFSPQTYQQCGDSSKHTAEVRAVCVCACMRACTVNQ